MKGIIFNLLEEVVTARHGEAAWDALLDKADLTGAYTSLGSYPDEELEALVATACGMLGLSRDACLRWFGREAMPLLSKRYPVFFEGHHTTLPFILSVNSIIHPEVRKIHPGAHCPVFHFEHAADGALRLGYQSQRQLCALAESFIEGAAGIFAERATVEHLNCIAKGDARCVLNIRVAAEKTADAARSVAH